MYDQAGYERFLAETPYETRQDFQTVAELRQVSGKTDSYAYE